MRITRSNLNLGRGLLLVGLVGMSAAPLSAEDPTIYPGWTDRPDGVPVRQGYHIEWQRSAEGGNPGELIISWSDTRFGMRDLFAQKIDSANPASPAMWSTDDADHGMVDALIVNDDVIRQEDPVLISDGAGGAIVSWIDFRDDPAGDIYVNRLVDGDGNGGLAWGEDGVLLCDECANGSENMSKSHCIDGQGGAWVTWADSRGSNWDIYTAHVEADGTIDPDFGVNGLPVVNEVGDQRVLTTEHDGAGGVFIAWIDKRDAADDNIYIQHVNADGTMSGQTNGEPVAVIAGSQQSVKVTWDGGTGCYVAWVDLRADNAGDIYIQHYDADLNPTFAENGVAVANQVNNQEKNPRLSYAGDGNTLLMWEDNRNDPGNQQADIYVQKMSTDDLEQWGAGGVPATEAEGNQLQARVSGDGAGGAFVVWQDYRTESYSSIYAQKLDANGNQLWAADGSVVIDRVDIESDAIAPALRADDQGGLFVAWGDLSLGSLGIFTQHLDASGNIGFASNGHESAWGIAGSCTNVRNIGTEEGTLVFWTDPRNSGGPHVYMQFLDRETGDPMLAANGVPVALDLEGEQHNYQVLADGMGGAYVLIESGSESAQQGFLTHVNAQGQDLWGGPQAVTPAFDTFTGLEYQERNRLLKVGDRIIVAWSGVDTDYADFFGEVFVQAFDLDGNILWGDSGLRITETPSIHEKFSSVAPGPDGSIYVLWDSGTWIDTNVLCQRIDASGNLVYPVDGLPFADGTGKQERGQGIAGDHGNLLGIFLDYSVEFSDSDIIARSLAADGTVEWTTEIDMRTGSQKTPLILSDGAGGAFITYTDFSNGSDDDVYGQHLLADGSIAWDESEYGIFVGAGTQEDVTATVVPRGGWHGLVVALSGEETGDTTGYKDIWMRDSHVDPVSGDIAEERYSGILFNFFHTQREPFLSYDHADGVYLSWVDMRASGKEDIKDIYTQRVGEVDTDLDPESPQLRGFQLAQNMPNPFNPVTRISFQLLRGSDVNLRVFDMAGRQVAELLSEELGAGTHTVTFDGSQLASGLYVYQIEAGGYTDSRKMLLVK